MTDEWTDYLKSLGFQHPLLQRADSVLRFYRDVAGMTVSQIFVSEYRDSDKGRVYESLWVFSEECVGESKLVGKRDDFDLIRLRNSVARWNVETTEFGLGDTATDASRLRITFQSLSPYVGGELKASGANCLRLAEVFRKFILPGLNCATP